MTQAIKLPREMRVKEMHLSPVRDIPKTRKFREKGKKFGGTEADLFEESP
jgi:hypothetical protein